MPNSNERKILECDGLGCETACCYGCKCCEEKSKIIKQQKEKIEQQQSQILELFTRQQVNLGTVTFNTSQGEIIRLQTNNERLRGERNAWKAKSEELFNGAKDLENYCKQLEENNNKLEQLLDELEQEVDNLKEQLSNKANDLQAKQQQAEQRIKQIELKVVEVSKK